MFVMSHVRVFSAVYGGIRWAKWHHLGAVGNVMGKEMGKEFWSAFFLNNPANHASPLHLFRG